MGPFIMLIYLLKWLALKTGDTCADTLVVSEISVIYRHI